VSQEIEQTIASLRARLQFKATANASSLGDRVNEGATTSKPPPFSGDSLADEADRLLWNAVHEIEKRERAFDHAQVGMLTADQLRYWVIVANEGRTPSDVADRLGVDVSAVVAIRERDGRNTATGKVRKGPGGRPLSGLKVSDSGDK
jgi:hypothetical protein